MVAIPLHLGPMKHMVAVASAHAITDVVTSPPHRLWPYTLILLPQQTYPEVSVAITCTFLLASLCHFAQDVGFLASVVLHAFWMWTFATGHDAWGWVTFSVYYSVVHAPLHVHHAWTLTTCSSRRMVIVALLFVCGMFFLACEPPSLISDRMQMLVVAHTLVDAEHKT